MRKVIVAGNWKMNTDWSEAKSLFETIRDGADDESNLDGIFIFPPFPYLSMLKELNSRSYIQIGSQNIAFQKSGAFTGEVSASMIRSLGLEFTLIGHSERRAIFSESNEIIKEKVDRAVESDLKIIFCCGESLEDRKANQQESVIEKQLNASLFHLSLHDFKNVTIAYEPVWAIGTGETATSTQAEEMHAFIRSLIENKYGDEIAKSTHILYGGSCNSANAKELFSCENVDGGLIGGASLKSEEFLKIIAIANE